MEDDKAFLAVSGQFGSSAIHFHCISSKYVKRKNIKKYENCVSDDDLITTSEFSKQFEVPVNNYVKIENDDWVSFDFTNNFFFASNLQMKFRKKFLRFQSTCGDLMKKEDRF